MTIKALCDWLQSEADLHDAFGPTLPGHKLRLAASVITLMEAKLTRQIGELQSEVDRLSREYARGQV